METTREDRLGTGESRGAGARRNSFDLSTWAKRFRFVAMFEALTWLGLLIGMALKYLPAESNDLGVKIFGRLHGAAFLLYIPTCGFTIRRLRWGKLTAVAALLASLPPFGTFFFEVWAARTGRLGELSKSAGQTPVA